MKNPLVSDHNITRWQVPRTKVPRPKLPPIPPELDAVTDVVLAYHPKPKSKAAKKRTRKAKSLNK